jgi:opacity protein-like surface antigen
MYRVELTPTLSISASSGLSINTSKSGPSVANNSTVTITKLWERASLVGGLRKGLTPSFGIAGVSDTTTFFSNFAIQLSERISGNALVDFSLYDTDDVNFKTFQVNAGLQYLITTWLSSGLSYTYRSIDSGVGANNTDLLTRGNISGSSIFLNITAKFDLWPNTGLARNLSSTALSPVMRTPFPILPVSPPSNP